MSNLLPKYATFVDLLLTKTKASKIAWEFDNQRNTVGVWNGDVLLSVTYGLDDNFEEEYVLTLHNRSGVCLESFKDIDLSNIDVKEGEDNYFAKMKSLYELAMRQATGADKALDEFIEAVRSDKLEFPF